MIMKAIKIDVIKQEVYEVDITSDFRDIYKQIDADCFTSAYSRKNKDHLFVDDEGLLRNKPLGAFVIKEYQQVLSGHGLLIGINGGGASISCKSTVEEIRKMITFVDVKWLKGIPLEPQVINLTDDEFKQYFETGELPLAKQPINLQ